MKKIFSLIVLLTVLLNSVVILFTPTTAQAASKTSPIIISEIKWGGSPNTINDAWIELYNTSSSHVSLNNWVLANASLNGKDIVLSGTIHPKSFFLISRFNKQNPRTVLNVTPDFITNITVLPKLHLNSICQNTILLKDHSGEIADKVPCSKWSATDVNASMERSVNNNVYGASASWYSSKSNINLDNYSIYGSPKAANDRTVPTSGYVNDGYYVDSDIMYHNNKHYLPVMFGGFFDPQTGINNFLVGVGTAPGLDDAIPFTSTVRRQLSLKAPTQLINGKKYFTTVIAINGVGGRSAAISSNGVIVETTKPLPPTNVTAIDTPNDNGTSLNVNWEKSQSTDLITYTITYNIVGDATKHVISGILGNSYTITNLIVNTDYLVSVRSVDFATRKSVEVSTTAKTINNIKQVVDQEKLKKNEVDVVVASTGTGPASDKPSTSTGGGVVVTTTPTGSTQSPITERDLPRIALVALILLAVAFGFFALSRAFGEEKEEMTPVDNKKNSSKPLLIKKTKTKAKSKKGKAKKRKT